MSDWIAIGALAVVAVLIPVGMMVVSWLLRPSVPEPNKRATYESAEVPTGSSREIRFNIQYYMVALLFVVFDIETVFIIPWTGIFEEAVANEAVGLVHTFAPMVVFVGILVIALAWAWRNGAVQWIRSPHAESQRVE